ncbi:MAG: hypothetical protein ACPL1A_08165 [Candidatus Kapaibacteriota bacterium]
MKSFVQILFFIILTYSYSFSQEFHKGTIDTVISFKPGKGQNSGQSPEFFPQNIFGLPSRNASKYIPETSQSEILSLGLSGEITVSFKNYWVYDGPGDDFIVFENAFVNPINNKVFAEPAVVSVSEDGINFIEFPYNLENLKGCAGTNPTDGKADPFSPEVSGGNAFDLATIGLTKIKYIKIKDLTDSILADPNHQFYDATLSGFDLDAITSRYLVDDDYTSVKTEQIININNFEKFRNGNKFEIYNYLGINILATNDYKYFIRKLNELSNLLIFIKIEDSDNIYLFATIK